MSSFSFSALHRLDCLFDWSQGLFKKIGTQLFKTCTAYSRIEVYPIKQRIYLDDRLRLNAEAHTSKKVSKTHRGRQCSFSPLTSRAQTSNSSRIVFHVLAVFALELIHKMLNQTIIHVLSPQMSISCG